MAFGRLVVFCCFIGASFARTDQEIKREFVEQAVICSKEIPVSGDEFQNIKDHKIPDNMNAKCLVKCVLHKKGMVDDKGMFDESSSIKMSEKEYEGDKEKIESSKKLYEICRKVNDESLSDDSGCERAALLATCLTEHAPKMGFSIQ
ncbi:general odorant-binding protein 19d-like [Maniola hyperantus]|uniref:general odorant-binding protein 19d-like n=1 Tax=Aphantopus hyperantus TaxID=2795564 RepID=UPI0015684EEC|nr:uncharacterized protein LOC117989401 [Maniola hyperantus]